MAAAACSAGAADGQAGLSRLLRDQHADDGTAAAAEMLQSAISRALGVDASQLIYHTLQDTQLSELLQKQQVPQPARQHTLAQASSSSAGAGAGSRPPSRGPSPLRGSSASSISSNKGGTLSLPLPTQHQQPWSVVVGFREENCEFTLGRLEEILQCSSAVGGDTARVQETTKQLQVCVHSLEGSGQGRPT
jgi:hypothetical protein